MSPLELRYRRLLRLYPSLHRRAHEDEMLAVLLACAAPDQQRPTIVDRFDLVRGALKVRWRHLESAFGPRWTDALAVVSLVAPLLMLACSSNPALAKALDGDFDPRGLDGSLHPTDVLTSAYVVGWSVVVVTALAGRRSISAATAAVLAVGALACRVADIAQGYWSDMLDPPLILTGLIAALALVASPGPRRGAQLIGVPGTLLVVATAVLVFVLNAGIGLVPYRGEVPVLGLAGYLLLVPALGGRTGLRLRAAALVAPHVAGAATFWISMETGLFREYVMTQNGFGIRVVEYEGPYYSAYAVALVGLLSLLLRARTARDEDPECEPSAGRSPGRSRPA